MYVFSELVTEAIDFIICKRPLQGLMQFCKFLLEARRAAYLYLLGNLDYDRYGSFLVLCASLSII